MWKVTLTRLEPGKSGVLARVVITGKGGWAKFGFLTIPYDELCRKDVLRALMEHGSGEDLPPPWDDVPLF